MDERELSRRIKALGKAVSSNEPTSAIIAIMDNLKKDAAPTEEMLRVSSSCPSCLPFICERPLFSFSCSGSAST